MTTFHASREEIRGLQQQVGLYLRELQPDDAFVFDLLE